MKKILYLLPVIMLLVAGCQLSKTSNQINVPLNNGSSGICTAEAKICPDGSAVGRTGQSCQFAECPAVATNTALDLGHSCTHSGGTISSSTCCLSGSDYPNSCSIGACGCSPSNSHKVKTCSCPDKQCFDGKKCVGPDVKPLEVTIYCSAKFCAPEKIDAGAGTLAQGCYRNSEECTATWKTLLDPKLGFVYKYPATFGANVWKAETWPAKATVTPVTTDPVVIGCPDIDLKANSSKPQKVTISDMPFYYVTSSDVGAGQLYTAYCYYTQKAKNYYVLEFLVHSHTGCEQGGCGAYCDTAYEAECRAFDLQRDVETPIREMVSTFKFIK